MKVWSLGSGSAGNAVLVEDGEDRILVDAGFALRTLAARLASIGVEPQSIRACVVTHEHGDHVRGAADGASRFGWRLFASAGTMAACPALFSEGCESVPSRGEVVIGQFTLVTRRVPHDALEPIGVRLQSAGSGTSVTVCTDLGHASEDVRDLCTGADIVIIEANHDRALLRSGPYPPSVQARIGSRTGHLSNAAAVALCRAVAHRGLSHVVLAHLSERCNEVGLARGAMEAGLRGTRFRGRVHVATQHQVMGPIVAGSHRHEAPAQLALAL